jgi:hypothetical protein
MDRILMVEKDDLVFVDDSIASLSILEPRSEEPSRSRGHRVTSQLYSIASLVNDCITTRHLYELTTSDMLELDRHPISNERSFTIAF